ncbi:MAG: hypothetical protein DRP35_09060 [Candidatus Zixiibacteriota bacterium]|nr:MAG: hypothetical protein DRP35_09060 [candidate division Zixibacteria bacterium]
MKKKRTYDLRLIKKRHSYSTSELSKKLNVHPRTIQVWRKQGMVPIEAHSRKLLFMGFEIIRFISEKQQKRKQKLKVNEFFCPRCKSPKTSMLNDIKILVTNKKIGIDDLSIHIKGICEKCHCTLTRFSSKTKLKNSYWGLKLKEGHVRLEGYPPSALNTDIKQEILW